MKKRKFLAALSIALVSLTFVCASIITATQAWFGFAASHAPTWKGSSEGAYFAYGNGKVRPDPESIDETNADDSPYGITRPIHLYNLAWLQYLGYFDVNNVDDSYNLDNVHFELAADIDMTGWTLPPIGTPDHPFIGNFNGNGYKITGLTVSNDLNDYNRIPFGINRSDFPNDVNVLGLFGVVGQYNGQAIATYNSQANEIVNLGINNLIVKSKSSTTLIGLAAGYVNGTIDGVAINNSNIDMSLNPTCNPISGITSNLSDYSLAGYVEDEYLGKFQLSTTTHQMPTVFNPFVEAGGNEWGGSIGMDEVYTRLDTYRRENNTNLKARLRPQTSEYHYYNNGVEDISRATTATSNVSTTMYYDSQNPLKGRVVFNYNGEGNFLFGKRSYDYTTTNEYHTTTQKPAYYVHNGDYYLRGTNTGISSTNSTTNRTLLLTDDYGWVYFTYNNQNYYIYSENYNTGNNDRTLNVSTNRQNYMYQIEGDSLRLYSRNTNNTKGTGYTKYVYYYTRNNTRTFQGRDSDNITVETTTTTVENTNTETITTQRYTNGSYLPLNIYKTASDITELEIASITDENITASDLVVNGAKLNNTGYIVGGTKSMTDNYGSGIRIANNYNYNHIRRALGSTSGSGNTYSASKLQVLTKTKDTGGKAVYISDKYNKNTNLVSTQTSLSYLVSGTQRRTVEDLGLQRYTKSRENLDRQFTKNTSNLYCMRFNEYDITLENTVIADKALINGKLKTNYALPESCIDFNLKEKGFINFFGGAFRGEDNLSSFFSLYHVQRNQNDELTSLKRIGKIYGTGDKDDPYAYRYTDNTYAIYDPDTKSYNTIASVPNGYTEQFDMAWIESPGFTGMDYTVWYFEIPVNEGEYALGSAKDSNNNNLVGGYMFYLDIGASQKNTDGITINEVSTTVTNRYTCPLGIDFSTVSTDVTGDYSAVIGGNSSAITIPTGTKKDINYTYTARTTTSEALLSVGPSGETVNYALQYKPIGLEVKDKTNHALSVVSPNVAYQTTDIMQREIFYDFSDYESGDEIAPTISTIHTINGSEGDEVLSTGATITFTDEIRDSLTNFNPEQPINLFTIEYSKPLNIEQSNLAELITSYNAIVKTYTLQFESTDNNPTDSRFTLLNLSQADPLLAGVTHTYTIIISNSDVDGNTSTTITSSNSNAYLNKTIIVITIKQA